MANQWTIATLLEMLCIYFFFYFVMIDIFLIEDFNEEEYLRTIISYLLCAITQKVIDKKKMQLN